MNTKIIQYSIRHSDKPLAYSLKHINSHKIINPDYAYIEKKVCIYKVDLAPMRGSWETLTITIAGYRDLVSFLSRIRHMYFYTCRAKNSAQEEAIIVDPLSYYNEQVFVYDEKDEYYYTSVEF